MSTRKKIAVIGTGISGLGIAYLLHPHHEITVYERNAYPGGHSRTVDARMPDGIVPVDTGFIVFNDRNYPLLTGLFKHLDVPFVKSDMSFGVSIRQGWLEYSTQSLGHLFAQKRNLVRPSFLRMVSDILRFFRGAKTYLNSEPEITLGECLERLSMGEWFKHYYLLAMGGAIWSTPLTEMLGFPASTFVRFFENHGLLSVNDQPQWYTVQGGSREYIRRLIAPFQAQLRLSCPVEKVIRKQGKVTVIDARGGKEIFDEVVFACHADQALSMMENPTSEERRILSSFRFQPNRAVLHRDISFMPKGKKSWASWVYLSEAERDENPCVSLSYWMNNLQPLDTAHPLIVTLNPGRVPDPLLVLDDHSFEHPLFDVAAIRAQQAISQLQGKDHFWFCGAYLRYGFHEDGLGSAVTVARLMGIEKPWI